MSGQGRLRSLLGEDAPQFGLTWVGRRALAEWAESASAPHEADPLVEFAVGFRFDAVAVDAREEAAGATAEALADAGVVPMWALAGIFTRVAEDMGWAETMRASAARPESLVAPLDRALHEVLQSLRKGLSVPTPIVLLGDELASTEGWLVSPDLAIDVLMPAYARIVAEAHTSGVACVFHSDGDIRSLMPVLADAGFSGVHTAVKGDQLASALGSSSRSGLALFGGVDSSALTKGLSTADGVDLIRMAVESGLIICDDGGITEGPQLQRYGAMAASLRQAVDDGTEWGMPG